jgi:hypothetical protein
LQDHPEQQQHLQQHEPSQQQDVVHHVVLTADQLTQLKGALGSGGADLSALSGSLGSNELLQRLMSPAAQAGPDTAEPLQHAQQQQLDMETSYMEVPLPSSSGMEPHAAAAQQGNTAAGAEAGVLQQGDAAGAAVADGQQQGALVDAVGAVMLPKDVQQGVKRRAGECTGVPGVYVPGSCE